MLPGWISEQLRFWSGLPHGYGQVRQLTRSLACLRTAAWQDGPAPETLAMRRCLRAYCQSRINSHVSTRNTSW